jgi:integrase
LKIRNLSAHDLRHSFARNAIDAGADIAKVMQSGGWESPEMVLRYVGQYEIANDGMGQIE